MPLPPPASEFYGAQQRLTVATLGLTRTLWDRMSLDDIDGSWARIRKPMLSVVSSAQMGAARNGASYIGPTLDALNDHVDPLAMVNPRGFAGFASDGRPLESLLDGAKVYAKQSQSLKAAGSWLDMVVHTQVQDAGRQSAGVDMFTRPGVGYVRAVNAPCCQRCAVLAGRFYKVSGFKRHPRCDCYMIPSTVAQPNGFGQSIEPGDVKDLTKAQRQAIDDGADMNRVINSHRAGRLSDDGMTTTELAKRGQRRLTPEAIYRVSATREDALRLLQENGYITPATSRVAAPVRTVASRPAGLLSESQYRAFRAESTWSAETRDAILAKLRSTENGKILADTLDKFQDGGSIGALRSSIAKRLAGESLPAMSAKRADVVIDALRHAPSEGVPSTLFRGMSIKGSQKTLLERYVAGSDIDFNLTSFTSDRKVATRFQSMTAKKGTTRVMVEFIGDDKAALPIQNLARDRRLHREKEWIGAGRYEVVEVKKSPSGGVILRIRQKARL